MRAHPTEVMSSCRPGGVHQRAPQGQGRPEELGQGLEQSVGCSTGSTEAVSLREAVARAAGWSAASGAGVSGLTGCGKDSAGPQSDGDTVEGDPALPDTWTPPSSTEVPLLLLSSPPCVHQALYRCRELLGL